VRANSGVDSGRAGDDVGEYSGIKDVRTTFRGRVDPGVKNIRADPGVDDARAAFGECANTGVNDVVDVGERVDAGVCADPGVDDARANSGVSGERADDDVCEYSSVDDIRVNGSRSWKGTAA
jgi:hypothetical protein